MFGRLDSSQKRRPNASFCFHSHHHSPRSRPGERTDFVQLCGHSTVTRHYVYPDSSVDTWRGSAAPDCIGCLPIFSPARCGLDRITILPHHQLTRGVRTSRAAVYAPRGEDFYHHIEVSAEQIWLTPARGCRVSRL